MSSSTLKGIRIHQNQIKILQYADDTIIFLDNNENALNETLDLLKRFGSASGLTINWSKSDLFPLGPLAEKVPSFVHNVNVNLSFGTVRFQYVGIFFTHNGNDLFRLNYIQKPSRLKNCLRMWSCKDLTPIGRITQVESFALSAGIPFFGFTKSP